MATVNKIIELLNCTAETAERILETMYQWVSPDWSESSNEDLRIDLLVAAECEGIPIEATA